MKALQATHIDTNTGYLFKLPKCAEQEDGTWDVFVAGDWVTTEASGTWSLTPISFGVDTALAATPSEDGGELSDTDESWSAALLEVAVVLEAVSSRDSAERLANMNAGKTLGRAFGRLKSIRAQHSRIVAAKDAEIARLENELSETELRALKFIHQCNAHVDLYRELRAERDELRAQLNAQPARNEVVIDLDALAWESIKEAANNSPWMPEQYMLNDWVADVCAFLREPARQVGGDERESWFHCPHCGTHEVSLGRTCHNSSCPEYAYAKTVHEGWKARAALGKSDG